MNPLLILAGLGGLAFLALRNNATTATQNSLRVSAMPSIALRALIIAPDTDPSLRSAAHSELTRRGETS